MKLGLFAALSSPFHTPEIITELATQADQRGFDTLWAAEHVVLFDDYQSRYPYSADGKIPVPPNTGMLEPHTTLAYIAAITDRIRLGTGIELLGQRHPVYAAKEIANIDYLSGGRFDLGVGAGWCEEEFEACNVGWERRGARLDEYLELLKELWTSERPSFRGEFWTLPECRMDPKPAQSPHPPIHVGGHSDAALKRTARLADGWYVFQKEPDELAPYLQKLSAMCEEQGRSLDEIEITACPYFAGLTPEKVREYHQAGVGNATTLLWVGSVDEVGPSLDALMPCLEAAHSLG
ncbi:MAG TPA: LLM class F420-dependent oxidoreductase [Acidimicrobiales bacterium]